MTKACLLALSAAGVLAATLATRPALADGPSVATTQAEPPVLAPSPPSPPPPPPANEARPPVLGYVFLGVGAAALATGAFFGVKQQLQYNDLQNTCAPRCAQSDVDAIADQRIAAGISAAAGVVLVTVGAVLVLSTRSTKVAVGVAPGGGAGLSWTLAQ